MAAHVIQRAVSLARFKSWTVSVVKVEPYNLDSTSTQRLEPQQVRVINHNANSLSFLVNRFVIVNARLLQQKIRYVYGVKET